MRLFFTLGFILMANSSIAGWLNHDNERVDYCNQRGGEVKTMQAQFVTSKGPRRGISYKFCYFNQKQGEAGQSKKAHERAVPSGQHLLIGLKSFASPKATIAATMLHKLPEVKHNSPLLKGPYDNPANNLCHNLKGATIQSYVQVGGFGSSSLAHQSMCVFGDGSMVKSWTLLFMSRDRPGYEPVRQKINASALAIDMPKTQTSSQNGPNQNKKAK